jgi:hypothetical protein
MDESINSQEEVISNEEIQDETLEQEVNDTQDVQEEQAEVVEQEEVEEVEETQELSRRQQKAVDRVEAQAKELGLTKILDRITQVKQPTQRQSNSQGLNYRDVMEAPDDVIQQLEQDRDAVRSQARNEVLDEVRRVQFETNLKIDLPLVQDKLSKLDPSAAQALDRAYLQFVGFNPQTGVPAVDGVSYAEFIDAQLELANSIATNRVVDTQRNIAKQAAQAGVRPDGGVRQGFKLNSVEDMRNLSAEDFEKNREAIYRQAGIPYNK